MSVPAGAEAFLGFVDNYASFAVIGHEEPDGDCLCSQLALASFLQKRGKTARCYTPGPFNRPEVMRFSKVVSTGTLANEEAAVIVDCSTLERIGGYAGEVDELPIAVIDHHASGRPFGDVQYIDPQAPSVTYLILRLIELTGAVPDEEEAKLLFFGLCTDTGFFRHLDADSGMTFSAAARLTDAGASPKATFADMYGHRSFDSRRLLGVLMERAEQRFDGRLLVTWETVEEVERFGKEMRDSDTLYQQLLGVEGCEAVVLVRQEDKDTCSVGLRSLHDIDVGLVAKHFGGGGHQRAAGFTRVGSAVDVVAEIVGYLTSIL